MRLKLPLRYFLFLLPIIGCKHESVYTPLIRTSDQPNIVLILADDMGYNDLQRHLQISPNGRVSRFVNIWATEVENFTTMANCTPSRHALMTGIYPFKHGRNSYGMKPTVPNYGLVSEKTLAEELKENGYKTALFGKWHLAETYTPDPNTFPFNRGFDYFFGLLGGSIDYYDHQQGGGFYDLYENERCVKNEYEGLSMTDLIAQKTVNFIRKNRPDPFFAFVSFTAPHKPYNNNPNNNGTYVGCNSLDVSRFWLMQDLVDGISSILVELDNAGLTDDTIVILTSDNGSVPGECNSMLFNMPLREYKGKLYEGGIRTRFYVRYPNGRIGRQKIEATTASHLVDLYPTLTAFSGGFVDIETDGIDVSSVWRGQDQPDRIVINDLVPNARYVARSMGYKLAANPGDRITDLSPRDLVWELYNLVDDPAETVNLFGQGLPIEQVLMDSLLKASEEYVAPIYQEAAWDFKECLID